MARGGGSGLGGRGVKKGIGEEASSLSYFWGRRGFVHTARHVRPLGRMWLSAATQTIRSCCSNAVAAPIKARLTDARAAPSSSGTGDDPHSGIPPWRKEKICPPPLASQKIMD